MSRRGSPTGTRGPRRCPYRRGGARLEALHSAHKDGCVAHIVDSGALPAPEAGNAPLSLTKGNGSIDRGDIPAAWAEESPRIADSRPARGGHGHTTVYDFQAQVAVSRGPLSSRKTNRHRTNSEANGVGGAGVPNGGRIRDDGAVRVKASRLTPPGRASAAISPGCFRRPVFRHTISSMVSDEQIQQWADEAEAGYDVEEMKRRGRGRPGRGAEPMQVVAVRLTAEELAAVDAVAEREHISRSEAIRRALAGFAA